MTSQLPDRVDTVVVGAGLAGLSCALRLHRAGQRIAVLEAGDGVGGRVRTDVVDGFQLDRGFQVLLTSYPEVRRTLDLTALDVRSFAPGALIWINGEGYELGDPFRDRSTLIETVRNPVIPLADKLRVLRLRWKLRRGDARRLLHAPEQTTAERLAALGFSDRAITRFLAPLFAGIQLDPELATSSRMFDIIFRSLSEGRNGVPASGMGAIAIQLADELPADSVLLDAKVTDVRAGAARTADGVVHADHVVVATEGPAAAALLGVDDPGSLPVGCVWYHADVPPTTSRAIVLDGTNRGPVRNLAVMSNVSPTYAPAGSHLIAAATPGETGPDLAERSTAQLRGWFGPEVDDWSVLRVDRIAHGQPLQRPPLSPRQRTRLLPGVWVCGDHRDTGSIQGAMFSGRRTAEAILGLPPATAEPRPS